MIWVEQQAKIQTTPSEKDWWDIKGGDKLSVINTDKGAIGVLICYDSEFPELARHLVDQGAKIIFVPFATDTHQGYLRVRYCCMARAIENQCYMVLSGHTGIYLVFIIWISITAKVASLRHQTLLLLVTV